MLPGLHPGSRFTLVLPPELAHAESLLQAERAELETAFGLPVSITFADPGSGPRWLMSTEPADAPSLSWDADSGILRSIAANPAGLFATFNLLHTLIRSSGRTAHDSPVRSAGELVSRVTDEIAGSFPALRPRGHDWPSICARHLAEVEAADDPLADLQRWIAELDDVHTWVHRTGPTFDPPYVVRISDDAAVLIRVPQQTAAHRAGVRTGWRLIEEQVGQWSARTGAPAHARPLVAGRRLLSMPGGRPRQFLAESPDGRQLTWWEHQAQTEVVEFRQLDGQNGYLRIAAWTDPLRTDLRIESALAELADCRNLVVDLRGNTGGNLVLAQRTRDRFLHRPTDLGSIAYSTGDGHLGEPRALQGQPLDGRRWAGEVAVLTDALTCSASEDFLLGLQGLPHVQTIGEPSCGGSGRPRSVTLTPDLSLRISTALTYDRDGRCIEGLGIPVDMSGPAFDADRPLYDDALVAMATL